MWTNDAIDYLARDRQAELLRLAADIHLGLAAQTGREQKIGDELREVLHGLRRGLSFVAVIRKLVDRAGAQVASGSVRS